MPASKAQQKAVNKYVKANYDLYQIKMPKGKKATIKAHAAAQGESVNSFINRAIDQTMSQEPAGDPARHAEAGGILPLPPSKPLGRPQRPQERPCRSL